MLGLKLIGYEKFWSVLTGGGMATATVTLALWGIGNMTSDIPVPDSAALVAAVTGVIVTLYNAMNVFVTGQTPTAQNTTLPPENMLVAPETPKPATIVVFSGDDDKTVQENPVP